MSNRLWMPATLVQAGLATAALLGLSMVRAEEPDRCRAGQRACPSSEKGAKEREIESKLLSPVNLNFQETPLRQVIEDVSSWRGIDMVPDLPALREEGISLDRPVTVKLQGVPLKSALKLTLDQAGLTFVVQDEVVKITTPGRARGQLVQKVYQVADLVIPIKGCPEPAQAPKTEVRPVAVGEKAPRTAAVEHGPNPQQTTEDQLIALIKNTLQPRSWNDHGGAGTIDYFPLTMALVINQTLDMHEQVAELLEALRRLQDVQVVLEVRIASLGEGVWERVGLDLKARREEYEPKQGAPFTVTYLNDKQTFAFMEAIQGDRRTDVMQAPKLTTFNGQKATINVTEQKPFVTGVDVRWNGDQMVNVPRQEFIPLGFKMTVQPVAVADHRSVKLSLNAILTELEGGTVPLAPVATMFPKAGGTLPPAPVGTVFPKGGRPSPDTALFTQYIQTPRVATVLSLDRTLEIPEGQTAIVNGGWKRMREVRSEFGPPVLSRVPYVNRLFKNVGYGRECEEVVLMVTSRIIVNEAKEVRPADAPAIKEGVVRTVAVAPSPAEPPLAVVKEAPVRLMKIPRAANAPARESAAAQLIQKKVARLMEKYHQACADGRMDEARELATKALALDPACFSRDR